MKLITHKECVTFCLPDHWTAEETSEGDALFFDRPSDSGILRLKLLLARNESGGATKENLPSIMASIAQVNRENKTTTSSTGLSVVSYQSAPGENCITAYWLLGDIFDEYSMAIAIFSFSFDTSKDHNGELIDVLDMLGTQIDQAKIAPPPV